ncbi:MAG: carboxypeptidase-like regulatory domain-containing protein, partial [Bacteroidetes bacterium]|nr:carboxypeptidase-like regulatory domain-containing protein [Bacteroidota bacterium]
MKSLLHSSFIIACLFISAIGFAQTGAGTLKGKVIDKKTGEPLPFANVVIMAGETQIGGSATNFDGEYNIKPITPGTYDVKCAFVGYNPIVISGVIIRGDKISFQDLYLESGVNLDEVVVIEYVTPLIDKDGGASGGTVTRSDIDKMSARTAQAVASTVGGISTAGQAEGEISVRG